MVVPGAGKGGRPGLEPGLLDGGDGRAHRVVLEEGPEGSLGELGPTVLAPVGPAPGVEQHHVVVVAHAPVDAGYADGVPTQDLARGLQIPVVLLRGGRPSLRTSARRCT